MKRKDFLSGPVTADDWVPGLANGYGRDLIMSVVPRNAGPAGDADSFPMLCPRSPQAVRRALAVQTHPFCKTATKYGGVG